MVGGYAGKILRVNLSTGELTTEIPDESVLRKWVGGTGLGAMYLYDEISPNIEPFDPENRLIFTTGPLAGTRIPGGGTFSVSTKGCLTNGATSSQANGFWGAYLKFSGFDGIIVQGASEKPVYLYLHDGVAEIKDASHLTGKDIWETDELIKGELGYSKRQMSVACIGPSGENLVKFAAIVADKGHVAGHNGTGAVMGSKNLKAIAVARGGMKVELHDPGKISKLAAQIFETVKETSRGLYEYGTIPTYLRVEKISALPIKNYTTNIYPDPDKLEQFSPEYIRGKFEPKHNPCWACRMKHCHESTITEGPYTGMVIEEPEYEALSAMGSQIGVMEVASAMMLTHYVDRLGLEMNETGWVVGLAMECFEKGLISEADTNGLKLTWGNAEAAKELLFRIAKRQDFGNTLAEGVMRGAGLIGKGAADFAVHTMKGNTPRGYDHRGFQTEMFDKLTSNTSTLESRPMGVAAVDNDWKNVVDVATSGKHRMSFEDTLGTCRFATLVGLPLLAETLEAATGWDFSEQEAQDLGLRILNLFRVYNFRCGHTREMEAPSPRYGSTQVDGLLAGQVVFPNLDEMLDEYYTQMGWDITTGKPLPETLNQLGLDYVISDIW
ncbi:MAG: aldehyde ferredoxin oxidoreductase family protein [Dehalococcoidales bacterium]|nr:aldehyde ferredoxin oxidoreductase family protein [Dehalococcoidales bacterium]